MPSGVPTPVQCLAAKRRGVIEPHAGVRIGDQGDVRRAAEFSDDLFDRRGAFLERRYADKRADPAAALIPGGLAQIGAGVAARNRRAAHAHHIGQRCDTGDGRAVAGGGEHNHLVAGEVRCRRALAGEFAAAPGVGNLAAAGRLDLLDGNKLGRLKRGETVIGRFHQDDFRLRGKRMHHFDVQVLLGFPAVGRIRRGLAAARVHHLEIAIRDAWQAIWPRNSGAGLACASGDSVFPADDRQEQLKYIEKSRKPK